MKESKKRVTASFIKRLWLGISTRIYNEHSDDRRALIFASGRINWLVKGYFRDFNFCIMFGVKYAVIKNIDFVIGDVLNWGVPCFSITILHYRVFRSSMKNDFINVRFTKTVICSRPPFVSFCQIYHPDQKYIRRSLMYCCPETSVARKRSNKRSSYDFDIQASKQ